MLDDPPVLRPAARVLLIEQDRILLLRANVGDGDVWITPGRALPASSVARWLESSDATNRSES